MALSPDGKTAYVALGKANHVAVVDVASRNVKAYVLVGKRPWGLALSRDGQRLYVTNGQSDDLSDRRHVEPEGGHDARQGRPGAAHGRGR